MSDKTLISRPDFTGIKIDSIEPQLDKLLENCRSVIQSLSGGSSAGAIEHPTWQTLIQPLDEAHNALYLFWSPVSHLNAVMNSDELREVYKSCLPKLSAYYTELGQNEHLYKATLALVESAEFSELSAEQQQQLKHSLRDFKLGGVSLNDSDKQRYADIAQQLSTLTTEFSDNVLDATNAWSCLLDDASRLDGLPESAIAAARQRASEKDNEGFLINLEFPSYIAVMMYANDRALREELYTAYCTRASDKGPHAGKYDNSENINQILKLRAEQAALLGFDTYADLSVVPKMVDSPQQVLQFLDDLAERAVPLARQECADLRQFARESLGIEDLQPWDVTYASDRLKKQQYDLSDEELKPYFPASRVIPGMFAVVGRLFGLEISRRDDVDVYHPDVALYSITDKQGRLRGEFYMDNYARENKRGGAWMDVCATRQRVGEAVQLPIAYLTCNPIDLMSGHYQTGEALPDELLDKLRNARNFQSAMQLVRQLEFSLFDMHVHIQARADKNTDVQTILNSIRERVAAMPVPEFNRFQHGFSHIFAGGYSAGYFSYKWAEVLSADAFSRFEEDGIFNPDTGRDFLEHILEVGGSRSATRV